MESALIGMLNDICGQDIVNSILNSLSINLFSDDGTYSHALELARDLHNSVIKPFALMLMFIYFMLAVVDKLSAENFTWEQLWRQMAMLLVAKFLIDHGFEILDILFNIGMSLAHQIQEAAGLYGGATEEGVEHAKELITGFKTSLGLSGTWTSWLGDIILFAFLIIPWLLSWIMRLCVNIICYTRIIEIYVRATFAPVALSDFFHSGLQGSGWRFLKNFLAVCLQGGVILVIGVIFSALFEELVVDETNMFMFIGVYLAFFASAIMLMFKSLSITKELVGSNG